MNKYKKELLDHKLEHFDCKELIKTIMTLFKREINRGFLESEISIYNTDVKTIEKCFEIMKAEEFLYEYEIWENENFGVSIKYSLKLK